MPWVGSTYTVPVTFVDNSLATAEDQNAQDTDIASGITDCLNKNGLNIAAANINLGGFKIVSMAPGTAPTDAANLSQVTAVLNPGELKAYAGASAPSKWILCYGQAISRTTYALLFTAIGTIWGVGNGTTTFNVPDLRGRAPVGLDNMGGSAANRVTAGACGINGGTLGASGGDQNLEDHNHGIDDPGHDHGNTDSGHSHAYTRPNVAVFAAGGAGSVCQTTSDVQTGSANANITINSNTTGVTTLGTGSGSSGNMQPTAMVNWMIYTGV